MKSSECNRGPVGSFAWFELEYRIMLSLLQDREYQGEKIVLDTNSHFRGAILIVTAQPAINSKNPLRGHMWVYEALTAKKRSVARF